MFIATHHLSYSYPEAQDPALTDITLSFAPGWTGVVGSNGSGKSTLIKILCGLISPQYGSVSPRITGLICEQSTELEPDSIESFACDYSSQAIKLRTLLEINDDWLWRFDTLSHGERKRIQIACALAPEPPLLALDEPTNHLDAATRTLVRRALQAYHGVGLLVSHDRELLDNLVQGCVFLDKGFAQLIPGTYTHAKVQIDLRRQTTQTQRLQAKNELAHLKAEKTRREGIAAQSSARRSARHLDRHDHDGRERIKLAIYSGQDGKAGKLSKSMDKRVQEIQQCVTSLHVDKIYEGSLKLASKPSPRKVLAAMPAGSIVLGNSRNLRYPDLYIGNTDRIGLSGRNGAGKSTLLRALLERSTLDEGLLYIPQEVSDKEGCSLLAATKALPSTKRGQLLSIVARLDSSPARMLDGNRLSPGEARKLMLAKGLVSKPYLIVMDEPTNHLDLHSIEALQNVLQDCACALVLVSHDEPFLNDLVSIRWRFEAESGGGGERGDSVLHIE